jgi:hypothetical protein
MTAACARSQRRRGQALVETVLASLAFVTILLGGIYFAEVGYLSIKVQEATASALWDTTAENVHEFDDGVMTTKAVKAEQAGVEATARYADFDADVGGGATLQHVVTRAENLTVECGMRQAPFKPLELGTSASAAIRDTGNSLMQCTGSAQLTAIRIPEAFVEGEPFKVQHWERKPFLVCAVGRAKNGACGAKKFSLLLDDWGFTGDGETAECRVSKTGAGCNNDNYFAAVKNIYDASGGPGAYAGSELAELVVEETPLKRGKQERQFFLSFRGGESEYEEPLPTHMGRGDWPTTPKAPYPNGYQERPKCFLGMNCP